jgi:hypothetical protein
MKRPKRILFVLKLSQKKSIYSYGSFGLHNSATFVSNRLNKLGYQAKVVSVVDNNAIDKAICEFNPHVVCIEALWVVPEKFYELNKAHPNIKWVIRVHSKAPFLAMEGMAFEWLNRYKIVNNEIGKNNLKISCNNLTFNSEINDVKDYQSIHLPNIYDPNIRPFNSSYDYSKNHVDIGCFGALRPLKNQLLQAISAISFVNSINKLLNFHINSTRQEQKGENVLRNLRALFDGSKHTLIEHDWYPHKEFATKVIPLMDIGMQVSLSESFNIVTADFVNASVPIVVSEDVDWMPQSARVNANSSEEMVRKLHIYNSNRGSTIRHTHNLLSLNNYNIDATNIWKEFLG